MAPGHGNSGLPSLQLQHKQRLLDIAREAEALIGVFQKITAEIKEATEKGGTISIQPQMAYATGSLARMIKDWGVTEHLQTLGARQKKPIGLR